MYGQLIEQAEKYLRSLYSQDNVAAQLKRLLAELLAAGEANADAACRRLQLSRRTLQRRLRAEKTSFQKILNEVPASHFEKGFAMMGRMIDGAAVRRGIYAGAKDNMVIYTVIGGLKVTDKKIAELKKKGG